MARPAPVGPHVEQHRRRAALNFCRECRVGYGDGAGAAFRQPSFALAAHSFASRLNSWETIRRPAGRARDEVLGHRAFTVEISPRHNREGRGGASLLDNTRVRGTVL